MEKQHQQLAKKLANEAIAATTVAVVSEIGHDGPKMKKTVKNQGLKLIKLNKFMLYEITEKKH